ncbi:MAG: NAD(P)/FAD-dependent oxidoreductase, partial [Actinobacteria bacterium]|nr:NAD(P)/FAD-dependent oxidoreductase [Actinomycetota bacterium]
MSSKKVVVIGAGIAGLSAGCYLQMNGYHAQIFESHNKPGGLCTAWKRKGYTIEGGMHGLLGSSPPSPFYRLWSELVDMERIKFINWDLKAAFEFEDRERFYIYADLERLERYLKEISPEDGGVVEEFVNGVRR